MVTLQNKFNFSASDRFWTKDISYVDTVTTTSLRVQGIQEGRMAWSQRNTGLHLDPSLLEHKFVADIP